MSLTDEVGFVFMLHARSLFADKSSFILKNLVIFPPTVKFKFSMTYRQADIII